MLCLFSLGLLWILEFNEAEKVLRPMELTVKTSDLEKTQDILKSVFAHNRLEAEVRQIDPPTEDAPVGCIMYYLNLPLNLSTDVVSEQITALETETIDGIEWKNQKPTN